MPIQYQMARIALDGSKTIVMKGLETLYAAPITALSIRNHYITVFLH